MMQKRWRNLVYFIGV